LLDVRSGPLFVRDNPVFENKSPLKSSTSRTALPAFANAVLGLSFLGARPAAGRAGGLPDPSNWRLVDLLKIAHKEKRDQKCDTLSKWSFPAQHARCILFHM